LPSVTVTAKAWEPSASEDRAASVPEQATGEPSRAQLVVRVGEVPAVSE
jgi:hypothetical protein